MSEDGDELVLCLILRVELLHRYLHLVDVRLQELCRVSPLFGESGERKKDRCDKNGKKLDREEALVERCFGELRREEGTGHAERGEQKEPEYHGADIQAQRHPHEDRNETSEQDE